MARWESGTSLFSLKYDISMKSIFKIGIYLEVFYYKFPDLCEYEHVQQCTIVLFFYPSWTNLKLKKIETCIIFPRSHAVSINYLLSTVRNYRFDLRCSQQSLKNQSSFVTQITKDKALDKARLSRPTRGIRNAEAIKTRIYQRKSDLLGSPIDETIDSGKLAKNLNEYLNRDSSRWRAFATTRFPQRELQFHWRHVWLN